ncbi:hypothetical protein ACH4U7_21600 [Streptomyces sp. NPDC020845]|uniref:hypothetical protein n=1 Tax=Streptomyces sp. NPDC020845 TaxID=3365096 RepID=UPI0037A0C084
MTVTQLEKDITDQWAQLCPVAGYTSGWPQNKDIAHLFIPTTDAMHEANAKIVALRKRLSEISDADLRTTADKQLTLLATQLAWPQPGAAVQDCGDGAFYIKLLNTEFGRPDPKSWLPGFLDSAAKKIDFETDRLTKIPLDVTHRRQCLTAAAYCGATMRILEKDYSAKIDTVLKKLDHFKQTVDGSFKGLDADDIPTVIHVLREHTVAPTYTDGYPQLLADLYDFAPSAADLDTTATTWLEQDLTIVKALAAELASLLKLPRGSSVGDVWAEAGRKWPVGATPVKDAAKTCADFADTYLVEVPDGLKLSATPPFLVPMITGGQDIAVDFLTAKPQSCLYYTEDKTSALLTMLNVVVHEYSHGINFVLSAQRAGSPLLNLAGPMQVPLTEGQAFWREWDFWHAAADIVGHSGLTDTQREYLKLYGQTTCEQSQAIRAAQLETYIWRVVRHLRAMCDVEVNMGWRTFVDFLDQASEQTGLTEEFLFGECFTFLAQPGYAPAYAIDGIRYGQLQQQAVAKAGTVKDFNTKASAIGFYPWTVCDRKLQT